MTRLVTLTTVRNGFAVSARRWRPSRKRTRGLRPTPATVAEEDPRTNARGVFVRPFFRTVPASTTIRVRDVSVDRPVSTAIRVACTIVRSPHCLCNNYSRLRKSRYWSFVFLQDSDSAAFGPDAPAGPSRNARVDDVRGTTVIFFFGVFADGARRRVRPTTGESLQKRAFFLCHELSALRR